MSLGMTSKEPLNKSSFRRRPEPLPAQRSLHLQRGAAALMATVFLLLIVALLGGIGLRLSGTDVTDTALQSDSVEALFLAESGLERAAQRLASGVDCMSLLPDPGSPHSLGRGTFRISQSSVTLDGLCRVRVVGSVGLAGVTPAQRTLDGDISVAGSDIGWAVGQNGTIFKWGGSTWEDDTGGGFTNGVPTNRDLYGLYCVTDSDCWAVGENGVIAHWNGSVWDDNGVNESVTHELRSVYCNASDDCWAVGYNGGGRATIAHWNGTSWSETGGAINNTPNRDLYSVYCIAADDCWAVGQDYNGDGLIVHWDGNSWEDETGGGFTNSTPGRTLYGVYCIDTDDCWAVGENGTIVRWDGVTNEWDDDTFITDTEDTELHSVFCIAADDCWAVGNRRSGDGYIVHWDGTRWTDRNTGGFSTSLDNEDLNTVYCFGSGDCWALGDDGSAARLTGTAWTDVSTPTTSQNLYSIHFPDGTGGSVSLQRWREFIQ